MKQYLLLFISLLSISLSAEEITVDKAKELANIFYQKNHPQHLSASLQMVYDGETNQSRSSGKAPALYVFSNIQGKGFVVISGEDTTIPLLGYSYENDFPQENIPYNIQGWLDNMKSQIQYYRENDISNNSRAIGNIGEVVIKLDTPLWDQMDPYNTVCSKLYGQEVPTGCVITATAIAMRYHAWPPKGTGTAPQYRTNTTNTYISARNLEHEYLWDEMPYDYRGVTDEKPKELVAELMADLGVLLQADYNPVNGTGAYMNSIMKGLSNHMDYDKSGIYLRRDDNYDKEWYEILKNELHNNRPIIYDGSNNSAGHAFILDGYTTNDYFSVNWGWGSMYNGYFLLDIMNPGGSGVGGNNSHYNYYQGAVINLKKNEGGEPVELFQYREDVNGRFGLTVIEDNIDKNQTIKLAVSWVGNTGNTIINGKFMFGLVDANGNIKEELYWFPIEDLHSDLGWTFEQFITINSEIELGDRICCFYTSERNPEWTLIKGGEKCTWEIIVGVKKPIGENTKLRFNKKEKILYINTMRDVTVQAMHKGIELNSLNKLSDIEYSLTTEGLSTITLLLKKEDESEEISIKLGNE